LSKYVLFSPIGATDPVRNYYDGPLLHIVRHYRPSKVYLFFTKEMAGKIEEIKEALQGFKVEIEIIQSDIENPHDFDIFMDIFENLLNQIQEENQDSQILLNISSGTPQMKSALALEVVASNLILKPIQVATPMKGSNANTSHGGLIGENLDDLMEKGKYLEENRCIEPDILSFRRMTAKRDIVSLIHSYEYRGALNKTRENIGLFSKDVESLIDYARLRQNDNNQYGKNPWNREFSYTQDTRAKRACDYYCLLKSKGETGELSYFTLLLKPLAEYIGEDYLGSFKDEEVKPYLDEYYEEKKTGKFRPDYIWKNGRREVSYNLEQYIAIMKYKRKDKNIIGGFEEINNTIGIRNILAHDLHREENINYQKILKTLRHLILMTYGGKVKEESFELYERINKKIEYIL